MTSLPKISVIVPVYNAESYLCRCIDSILGQSYLNLEVLLIDDGSQDTSGEICDDYLLIDQRVRVYHQENQGQSSARNNGLQMATGDYIAFVDSDDWIDLDMYERMMSVILEHGVEVVECNVIHRKGDSEIKSGTKGTVFVENRHDALKRIIANQYFSVCRRLYKKTVLKGHEFPVDIFAEDVYYTIDLILSLDKLVVMTNPFYNYYKAGESTTRGPFKLKSMGSIDAALYVEEIVKSKIKQKDLNLVTKKFVLTKLLYNYKSLHHYPNLDKNLTLRKQVKKLLRERFSSNIKKTGKKTVRERFSSNIIDFKLLLANILPIRLYNFILKIYTNVKID